MPKEEKTLEDVRKEQNKEKNKELTLEDLRERKKKYKVEKTNKNEIWDTSGIINSNEFPKGFTVPEVMREVKDVNKFRTFGLKIEDPSDGAVRKIEKTMAKLKEHLSDADIKVLALAIEKDNTLIRTDDNGIQNMASYLDIPFKGNFFNIETEKKWGLYCDACSKWRESKTCEHCGNLTRRRTKADKKI